MSQTARITDDANRSTKKPSETLRPHFYTSFQNSCYATKANSTTTTTQRKDVLPIPMLFKREAEKLLGPLNELLIEELLRVASYSSVIPNIFFENTADYQVQRYLIDRIMLRMLEDADIINWEFRLSKLFPIRTSGNGNCLLHAVLIAMLGIHDSELYLRDRLVQFMNDNKDLLKTHWRIERLNVDKSYGISSEDSKLDDEWKELCDLVRYENSEDGQAATHLQFLEGVHVFATSNMLRRPIIILSEDVVRNKNGEAISVNDLYGIYLPILSPALECIKEPIVLAYDRSHFCPLQFVDASRENILENLLPLYPSKNHILEQTLLPIRFLGDDINAERSKDVLRDYLRIKEINHVFHSSSPPISIMCAELGSKHPPIKDNFFLLYHDYLIDFFKVQKPRFIEEEQQRELDEHRVRHSSYDSYDRPGTRLYSSPTRAGGTQLRDRNNSSYDVESYPSDIDRNRTFIPTSSSVYLKNGSTQSSDYGRQVHRDPTLDNDYYESRFKHSSRSNLDIIDNPTNNIRKTNRSEIQTDLTNTNPNEERQQSSVIHIPVHVLRSSSSSTDPKVTIYEDRSVHRNRCLFCDKICDNRSSTRICSDCTYNIHYSTSYGSLSSQPSTTRSRATNLYLPTSDHGYPSIISPTPKTRDPRKITCPRCKSPNVNYNPVYDKEFSCSACRNPIPSAFLY